MENGAVQLPLRNSALSFMPTLPSSAQSDHHRNRWSHPSLTSLASLSDTFIGDEQLFISINLSKQTFTFLFAAQISDRRGTFCGESTAEKSQVCLRILKAQPQALCIHSKPPQ